MKRITIFLLIIVATVLGCSNDDNDVDKTKPTIDISKSAFQNCTEVKKGGPFTFSAVVSDNVALGSYSFDIHHNFDHHTHSTEAGVVECSDAPDKTPINPFKLIKTSTITGSPKTYTITQQFTIPEEYEEGDYHFMIKVTDKAGWSELKGLSFKLIK